MDAPQMPELKDGKLIGGLLYNKTLPDAAPILPPASAPQ
jgi:hypothetical protein